MAARRGRRLRPNEWPEIFLAAVRSGKSISSSAEIAGVTRHAVYKRAERDAAFRVAYAEAREDLGDRLEEIAYERMNKPDKGLGSDWLLFQMLKSVRPERYRDDYVAPSQDLTGPQFDAFIRATQTALEEAELTDEQHRRFSNALTSELKRLEELPDRVDETTYRDLEDDVIDVPETKQLEA